jgi:hypothetical protein
MNIQSLVVNGCSYTETYAGGNGHVDLAAQLGIPSSKSLAISGSANSRILRTTLKHSYQTDQPTLYLIGMTFVSRLELPIQQEHNEHDSFEGRWVNPQNQEFSDRWEHYWNKQKTLEFVSFKLMIEAYSLLDRTEDLMYRVLATIADLKSRGHQALIYQQADDSYQSFAESPRLALFKKNPNIVGNFFWRAVEYQHQHNVPKSPLSSKNFVGPTHVPDHMRHPQPGAHRVINDFLYQYIKSNNLI